MKKYVMCLILISITIFVFVHLYTKEDKGVKEFKKSFTQNLPNGITSVEQYNDYEGVPYEGKVLYYFSFNKEKANLFINQIKAEKEWNPLPLDESINLVMYGGKKNNKEYGFSFADKVGLPHIKNGYWRFINRNNFNDLLNAQSFNFTLTIFDSDRNILYLFKIDT